MPERFPHRPDYHPQGDRGSSRNPSSSYRPQEMSSRQPFNYRNASYRNNNAYNHARSEYPGRSDRAPCTGPSYKRSPIRQSSSSRRQSPPPRSRSPRREKTRPYGASLPDSSDIVPETEELSSSSVRRESKKLAAIDQVVVPDKDHSEDNEQLIAPESTPNHSVRPAFSPKLKKNGSIKKADLPHKASSGEDQQRVAPARNPVDLAQESNEEEEPVLAHNADRLPIRTCKRSHPDTSESELDQSPSRPSSPDSETTAINEEELRERKWKKVEEFDEMTKRSKEERKQKIEEKAVVNRALEKVTKEFKKKEGPLQKKKEEFQKRKEDQSKERLDKLNNLANELGLLPGNPDDVDLFYEETKWFEFTEIGEKIKLEKLEAKQLEMEEQEVKSLGKQAEDKMAEMEKLKTEIEGLNEAIHSYHRKSERKTHRISSGKRRSKPKKPKLANTDKDDDQETEREKRLVRKQNREGMMMESGGQKSKGNEEVRAVDGEQLESERMGREETESYEKQKIGGESVPATQDNSPLAPLPLTPTMPNGATLAQTAKSVGSEESELLEKEKAGVAEKDALSLENGPLPPQSLVPAPEEATLVLPPKRVASPESGSSVMEKTGEQTATPVQEKDKEAEGEAPSLESETPEKERSGEEPVAEPVVQDLALDEIPLPPKSPFPPVPADAMEAAPAEKTQDAVTPGKEVSSEAVTPKPAGTPRLQPQPSSNPPGSLEKETFGEESGVRKEASVPAALSNNPLPPLPSNLPVSLPLVPAATAPVSSSCYPVQTIATPQEFALPKTAEIPLPPPRPASTTPEESAVNTSPTLSQGSLYSTHVARPKIGAKTTLLPTPSYPPLVLQALDEAALRNEPWGVTPSAATSPSSEAKWSLGAYAAYSAPDSPSHYWTRFPEQEATFPAPIGYGSYSLSPRRPSPPASVDQLVETTPAVAPKAASTQSSIAQRKLPALNTQSSFALKDMATTSPVADFPLSSTSEPAATAMDELEKEISGELATNSEARQLEYALQFIASHEAASNVPSTSGPAPPSTTKTSKSTRKTEPKAKPDPSGRVLRSAKNLK